jgi:hypothetical protein
MIRMNCLRLVLTFASLLCLIPAQAQPADTPFEWATKYNVGDTFPGFTLNDQNGDAQTAESLSGDKGFLISFNRSVVW